MGKGQEFERRVAKDLSVWFSKNQMLQKRTDLFWRTAGSGARATVRAKFGIGTENQKGDIAGTVPETAEWMKNTIIELKTGYKKLDLFDLLRDSLLVRWFAKLESESDDDTSWMLIHRNRRTLVFMNRNFAFEKIAWKNEDGKHSLVMFDGSKFDMVIVVSYEDFLKNAIPYILKK